MALRLSTLLFFVIAVFAVSAAAQTSEVLATAADGTKFTVASLPPDAQKAYLGREAEVGQARADMLEHYVARALLAAESASRKISLDDLVAAERKKVAEPTAAEIKKIYDVNSQVFANATLEQARPQIVQFLREAAEQRALAALVETLKPRYKFTRGKDINAANIKPADVIFTVDGKPYTAGDLDRTYMAEIYDIRVRQYQAVSEELETSVLAELITREAKKRNIDPSQFIAEEITDKLKDFSAGERFGLQDALKARLFKAAGVKILLVEPDPVARDVSPDDDPALGRADAPVTVIMFSDFQCPACAATHPVLKRAIAPYGDKVRFVVRDFPLEPIHSNAMHAAAAAGAAAKQGKFFEYAELLYSNQSQLDDASLRKYAASLGLNARQFDIDVSSEKTLAEIRKDMADGERYSVSSTPTVFVNGVKLYDRSEAGIRRMIDRALAAKK